MKMLRYSNKPPRRRSQKPVTKAMAQQRRAEALDRGFRGFMNFCFCAMGLMFLGIFIAQNRAVPHVGDRISFTAGLLGPGIAPVSVAARQIAGPWAAPGAACTLDERAMIASGGTLTITALQHSGAVLSWAGGATDSQHSCPAPGMVQVPAEGLAALRAAAAPHRAPVR